MRGNLFEVNNIKLYFCSWNRCKVYPLGDFNGLAACTVPFTSCKIARS